MADVSRKRIASRSEWGRPLYLVAGSQGNQGLLSAHPNHHFVLVEGVDRGEGYQGYLAVSYAYQELRQAGLRECAARLDDLTGIKAFASMAAEYKGKVSSLSQPIEPGI